MPLSAQLSYCDYDLVDEVEVVDDDDIPELLEPKTVLSDLDRSVQI